LGGAVQGAVAGFSALQGAMGLFGSESKDVEKLLLKVQSAMALQQGISGVAGAIDSFKLLAGNIKTQVVAAFTTLRGAIIATGLGALAVAVGLVIANFDKFKAAVFNLIPGLKGITDFVGGLVTKFTDFVGITNEAERNLEKFTKASKRSREEIEAQIKVLEAQGGQEAKVYSLKKQNIESELNDLREAAKQKGKLTEEEQKQIRDLKLEQQVLDIEESNRKKKLAEDDAKNRKDAATKLQKEKDEEEKIRKEKAQKLAEDRAKEERELNELLENERNALAEKEKEKQDQIQKELDEADQREFERLQERIQMQKEANAALVQAEVALQDAKFQAASAGLNAIATLAQGNEKLANVIFAIDRGLAIAKVVIDTQREIGGYFASYSALGPAGFAAATKFALAAKIRAGASIATIAATTIAKFKTGGGGGSSAGGGKIETTAPVAPQLAPQVQATQVNTAAVNQMGNRATRAYVLNSDIQNEQQRNAYINRNASIG
jgi:chemotaxis protein histidine kinase CheA